MAELPSHRGTGNARTGGLSADLPPQEPLWKRYSRHHELPLSGMSSLIVHLLIFGTLVLGGIVALGMTSGGGSGPSVGVLAIAEESAAGAKPGNASETFAHPEESLPPAQAPEAAPIPVIHESTLELPKAKPLDLLAGATGARVSVPGDDTTSKLNRLDKDAGTKLRQALANRQTGRVPSGPGPDKKEGLPPGRIENQRQSRQLRWTMTFETKDGNDYLRQLKALGAILAYQGPEGEYLVIRDLSKQPAKGENVPLPNRIYWIDDRPESVKSLGAALRIPGLKKIVAFFPEELEKDMLRKELAFHQAKEEAIHETKFKIRKTTNGYEPVVSEQALK